MNTHIIKSAWVAVLVLALVLTACGQNPTSAVLPTFTAGAASSPTPVPLIASPTLSAPDTAALGPTATPMPMLAGCGPTFELTSGQVFGKRGFYDLVQNISVVTIMPPPITVAPTKTSGTPLPRDTEPPGEETVAPQPTSTLEAGTNSALGNAPAATIIPPPITVAPTKTSGTPLPRDTEPPGEETVAPQPTSTLEVGINSALGNAPAATILPPPITVTPTGTIGTPLPRDTETPPGKPTFTPEATTTPVPAATTSPTPTSITTTTPAPGITRTPASAATEVSTPATSIEMMPTINGPQQLCVTLTRLLSEHAALLSIATNARLGARAAEYEAALAALEANTADLATVFGALYGQDNGAQFQTLWQSHIMAVLNYATARARADNTAIEQAQTDLSQFAQDLGALLNTLNPELSQPTVTEMVKQHLNHALTITDAQAADDQTSAFAHLRQAQVHMAQMAVTLAEAMVRQFPERFAP